MSLKDVTFKTSYTSLVDDIAEKFYVPVMENAIRFDRMTCYFSPRALSNYAVGLYYLGKKNSGKYRLLISEEVSVETFELIKDGYRASMLIDEHIRERMVEGLSLENRDNLSNLAFLMECGIVQIKFAFCKNGGLFHIKSGYIEDEYGNTLCFKGSNNETSESIRFNYESFDVTTSWLSSPHDSARIVDEKVRFEQMWAGGNEHVVVVDPNGSFMKYITSFNKGILIEPLKETSNNVFILDYDESIILKIPQSFEHVSQIKFRLGAQNQVNHVMNNTLFFKEGMSHNNARRIADNLKSYCASIGYSTELSISFQNFLNSCTTMEALAALGSSIKKHDRVHDTAYKIFKAVVDSVCVRRLTDEQMRDSYLLYNLKKGANFSVPGSGKTATILGMFAYLYESNMVKRIIVIGPLNSFGTWEYEFKAVFGNNIPLVSMNATDIRANNKQLDHCVSFNSGSSNLILLNYESFDHNTPLLDAVSGRIGDNTLLVFDEVHRIKSVNGKRATKLIPLGNKSRYTIVMTGTPIPNDYSDTYNFLHILYPQDYDDYFRFTPADLSSIQDADADIMNAKMQPFFCRTTKDELGVPRANKDNIVCVEATYAENQLLEMLRNSVIGPLAMIIRILQLESDPTLLNGHLSNLELSSFIDDEIPVEMGEFNIEQTCLTSKTSACINLVQKLSSEGKKVIVWCVFIRSIENIAAHLREIGLSVCTVNGNTADKSSALDSFKDGNIQILVTNPQTLAESVSLHTICHDAVYFEYSYNLVHLLQSKDRIHRFGLKTNQYTQYHFMQTEFEMDGLPMSLDGKILSRLDQKEQVMLEAIENGDMEHFSTTTKEVEDIVFELGIIPEAQYEKNSKTRK